MVTQEQRDNFIKDIQDFDAFWLTLWGEFRGEPAEAQIAGANVIYNRLHHGYNGPYKSIKEVVTKKEQFSCWNILDPNLPLIMDLPNHMGRNPVVEQLKYIAAGAISSVWLDNTNGANCYLTMALYMHPLCPSWAHTMKVTAHIGRTVFLR